MFGGPDPGGKPMRPQLVVGGLVGLFALALPVQGQLPPLAPPAGPPAPAAAAPITPITPAASPAATSIELATVIVPDVEVRSGASAQFYPTSKLRMNDRVQVLREVNKDWLAIKPPQRESF